MTIHIVRHKTTDLVQSRGGTLNEQQLPRVPAGTPGDPYAGFTREVFGEALDQLSTRQAIRAAQEDLAPQMEEIRKTQAEGRRFRGQTKNREFVEYSPERRRRLEKLHRKYLFLIRLHKRMAHDLRCQTREYREKASFAARMPK